MMSTGNKTAAECELCGVELDGIAARRAAATGENVRGGARASNPADATDGGSSAERRAYLRHLFEAQRRFGE